MADIKSLVAQVIGVIGNSALAKVDETDILGRLDTAVKTLKDDNAMPSKKDLAELVSREKAEYLAIKEQLDKVIDVTGGKTRLRK